MGSLGTLSEAIADDGATLVNGEGLGPVERLHGQWIIGDGAARPDDRFRAVDLGSATLFHDDLKPIPVEAAGALVGWLFGTPISIAAGRLVEGIYLVAEPLRTIDGWIESEIYQKLTGSFFFVLDHEGMLRLYLDAAGSLSAVYEPERRQVGATAEILLGSDYDARLIRRYSDDFEVGSDGWVSGDLTAHVGVKRLLANHYLDLERFEAVRHWPTGPLPKTLSLDEAARALTAAATPVVAAATAAPPAFFALTGGYDTRLVLSFAREQAKALEFMTIAAPGTERDIFLARQLSARFGLKHRVVPYARATAEQQEAWDRRVGHVVTGANRHMHPSIWALGRVLQIGGVGGEVGRGFLWLDATAETPLEPNMIIDRLKLARNIDLQTAVAAWLKSLPPELNTFDILDLAFIELRNSSWAFGQAYSNPITVKLNPLNSRPAYEAMLRSPPEARRGNVLFRRVIELNWPELLAVPINRYGNYRDRLEKVMLGLRRPDKALRKARQIVRTRLGKAGAPTSP